VAAVSAGPKESRSFPRQSARTRRFTLGEPRSITICADGTRVLFLRAVSGTDARTGLWCLDVGLGTERALVDPRSMPTDDGELPAAERARRERVRETASGIVSYSTDALGRTVVFAADGKLFGVDVDSGQLRTIPTGGPVYDPRIDPRGRVIGYVSGNALRVIGASGDNDRAVVESIDTTVSWGRAEHVAAEEMGRSRGFWWSPDGSALLVARVDEQAVTRWWIADPADPQTTPAELRYPRAGADNADVSLHLMTLDGASREITWDRETFCYLARVSWPVTGRPLLQVQARDQRRSQVLAVDAATGRTDLLCDDRDDIWVELFDGVPAWCGRSVVRIADVDGARRLFVGAEAVTAPDLYVRSVVDTDDAGVVFTGSLADPTQVHVFRWTTAGVEQLTDTPGVHGAVASSETAVVASASLDYVGQRHVVRRHGSEVVLRSVAETPGLQANVRMLVLGKSRLRAGLVMPTGHIAGLPLPVLVDPYAGPHVQRVLSAGRAWLEPQWWADQGFAVLVVDGRGTPGRDPDWERRVHLDLTGVLDDQVEGLLAAGETEPDLDLSRVAIRGWSFGGYLAALAVLRRPDVFHAAVAGAPVTDWTLYDTHYTERYLGMPADQPAAYARSSLLDDASNLSRPLLLVHGLADDNVVAAHTLRLSQLLTESGRAHNVVPLTGVTNMTPQETVAENLLLLQVEFLRRALRPVNE
jgi:dipeptidyl-peptidase-4